MPVDQSEILQKAVATLRADAGLLALTGDINPAAPTGEARVYNHVPQDEKQPYVLVVWESGSEGDTKDSTGFEGRLNHEIVSTHHGDREVLKMQDAVIAAYEAAPLVLVAGEIICFQFASGSTPISVFSTHRVVFFYNVIVDDDGVSGATLPPIAGGLIVVQEDGVDLPNTPHRKLNFDEGILAEDQGDGVAKITTAGGAGGEEVLGFQSDVNLGDMDPTPVRTQFFTPATKDQNSLEYLDSGVRQVRSASIEAESIITKDSDPNLIIDTIVFEDRPALFQGSPETVRGVLVTPTGNGEAGQSAEASWSWNGITVVLSIFVG